MRIVRARRQRKRNVNARRVAGVSGSLPLPRSNPIGLSQPSIRPRTRNSNQSRSGSSSQRPISRQAAAPQPRGFCIRLECRIGWGSTMIFCCVATVISRRRIGAASLTGAITAIAAAIGSASNPPFEPGEPFFSTTLTARDHRGTTMSKRARTLESGKSRYVE